MKINVEIDCTPEEARAAVGLPDLTPLHDKYVSMMLETMQGGGVPPEILENVMKSWAPMGEAGMNFWRRMFESGAKPG
jgi:oligoendopeptidase F